jgi:hypothetical protein
MQVKTRELWEDDKRGESKPDHDGEGSPICMGLNVQSGGQGVGGLLNSLDEANKE